MSDVKYEIAMSEVLHYLKGIRKKDVEKIPSKLIAFFEENSLKNYECGFDYTKPLKELESELKDETKGLIAMLCLNYWCETEEDKKNFIKHLNKNEQAYQEKLREKYNPDNIFSNKISEDKKYNEKKYDLIVIEEKSFIQKVINKIRKFIKLK